MPTSLPQHAHTGIRSAPLRNEPPRKSGATRFFEAISDGIRKMSTGARVALFGGMLIVVLGIGGGMAWRAATRPIPLYPTSAPEDVAQISPRLLAMGVRFSIEGSTILVDPAERPRIVGALLAYGFPRYRPRLDESGGLLANNAQRREQELARWRSDLTAEIQQFDCIAFANVNIAPGEADTVPVVKPRASILVSLKPDAHPGRSQVQAIVSLVASAIPGMDPADVKVVDTTGRVWNEGLRTLVDEGATDDEHLIVKRAYEQNYRVKLREALDRVLGAENYACTVDADLNFSQVKIVESHLGGPMGGERVVLQTDKLDETLDRDGKKENGGPYARHHVKEKAEVARVERTAILAPGAVDHLSASVVVDGQRSDADLETLRTLAQGALGHDAEVAVRCMPLQRTMSPLAAAPAPASVPIGTGISPLLLLCGLVPSLLLVAGAGVMLARTRETRARQAALELRTADNHEEKVQGIADLITDKLGTRQATRTTAIAPGATLEEWARERPSKVVDLLRSTWLNDKER